MNRSLFKTLTKRSVLRTLSVSSFAVLTCRPICDYSYVEKKTFNQTIDTKTLPSSLVSLKFGSLYDQETDIKTLQDRRMTEMKELIETKEYSDALVKFKSCTTIDEIVCKQERVTGGTYTIKIGTGIIDAEYYYPDGKLEYTRYVYWNDKDNYGLTTVTDYKPSGKPIGNYTIIHSDNRIVSSITGETDNIQQGEYIIYHNGKITFYGEYADDKLTKLHIATDDKGRNLVIPEKGTAVIVWKVCETDGKKKVYVELLVPRASKRKNSDMTNICIIESAIVVSIVDSEGKKYDRAHNYMYDKHVIQYIVGEQVKAHKYGIDEGGIYVFLYKDKCDKHVT